MTRGPVTDGDWLTSRIAVPVDQIGYVTAILEAYDNHFLIRTKTRGVGVVCIWHPAVNAEVLDKVIRDMETEIPVTRLGSEPGMAELEEIFPEDER